MALKAPVRKWNLRWLALLGGTLVIHLFVIGVVIFVATRQVGFVGAEIAVMIALFCLPAAWSAFILYKFRSVAERIIGIVSAISSLIWIFGIVDML